MSDTLPPSAHEAPLAVEPLHGIGFRTSVEMRDLLQAMLIFQTAAPVVVKKHTNGGTKSQYADLDDIWHCCVPLLSDNGLIPFMAPGPIRHTEQNNFTMSMVCRIAHISGQWIEHTGDIFIPAPIVGGQSRMEVTNAAMRAGSAITYMRRYMIVSMLNIMLGDDDDAKRAAEAGRTGGFTPPQDEADMKLATQPWPEQHRTNFNFGSIPLPDAQDWKPCREATMQELGQAMQAEIANGENNQYVLAEAARRVLGQAMKANVAQDGLALSTALEAAGWKGPSFFDMGAKDLLSVSKFIHEKFARKEAGK